MQDKTFGEMVWRVSSVLVDLALDLKIIRESCTELFKPDLTDAKKAVIKEQLLSTVSLEVREVGVATLPEVGKDLFTLSEYVNNICCGISRKLPQGFKESIPGCTQTFKDFRRASRLK